MYLTLRSERHATTAAPPPPLYNGTRLTEAVKAALDGAKEVHTVVYFKNIRLFTAAPGGQYEWHDKAAEAECRQRGIEGLE
jgi:hypothetical protein